MTGSQASPTPPPDGPSFEDRLRAARLKQGMDPPPRDHAAKPASPIGLGLRVGVELVSALVVAVGIGWGLDYWLGTKPWIMLAFVPIGGVAGILNIWRLFAPPRSGPTGPGPGLENNGAGDGRAES